MKTLPAKVRAVLALMSQLDKTIALLQKHSTLHCPAGCGKCCEKPAIEVTPLEFLPFALATFDNGQYDEILQVCTNDPTGLCVIFRPSVTKFGGLCNAYPHRGLMCRLFGYAARRNREGTAELVTCSIMKTSQKLSFNDFQNQLANGSYTPPFFADYYMKLRSIDADLCEMMPINQAIATAIKSVKHYYSYRQRRKPQGL